MMVEQRFAQALLALRHLRPFYAAVFQVIPKREGDVDTLAVTESELIYNAEYVEKTVMEELLFQLLHCIAHIALQHVPRRQGRDEQLWNTAADLYVNKLLAEELWLNGPGSVHRISGANSTVRMPDDCVFEPGIDLAADFVEKIYIAFEEQGKENGYFEHKMACDDMPGCFSFGGSGGKGQGKGKKEPSQLSIAHDDRTDLIDSGEKPTEAAMAANRVLSDAMALLEQSEFSAGSADCRILRMVEDMRRAPLTWKPLLQKYLRQSANHDSTFRRPDKRMLWQRAIYPGHLNDDKDRLSGLKICIDTSGSINDGQIELFYGQVYALAKQYGLESELIYWDVAIQGRCDLKEYKDRHRIKARGGGGTDPACLFRYFDSGEKPLISLIFTDGFFNEGWPETVWHRRYRDTIWVLERRHYHAFSPPFGKKATI